MNGWSQSGIASTPVGGIASTPVGGIGSAPAPWVGDAQSSSRDARTSAWPAASNGHAQPGSSRPTAWETAPTASAASGAAATASGVTLVVTGCTDAKMGDTVRGTFQQVSTNHGRPVFKRTDAPVGIRTAVLIYYWDDRDGPEMCGWWFGPEVGGDQVWAYNGARAPTPPGNGWKIPFDGSIDPTMRLRFLGSSAGSAGTPEAEKEPAWERPKPSAALPPPPPGRTVPGQSAPAAVPEYRRDWDWTASTQASSPPQRAAPANERSELDIEAFKARVRKEAEDASAQTVRRAIQRLSTVLPETLEQMSAELNKTQAEQWEKLGHHQQQVAEEIAAARLQAQERLLKIQAERADAERIKRAEEERLAVLVREASDQAAHAEAQVKEVMNKVADLKELELLVSPDEALEMAQYLSEAHRATVTLLEASLAGLDGTSVALEAELKNFPPGSPSAAAYAEARTKLGKLLTQGKSQRTSLDGLTDFVPDVRRRSRRRVASERRQERLHDLFSRYDADGDERLNLAELALLARHEYDMDLSQVVLSKVTRFIWRGGGVPFENFRRLRQMLGVECSEVRLREAINAVEERKRREQEEADRQRRDIADRKQRAQTLLDEASEFLSEAGQDLPKAEKAAKPLLAEERLGSDALQGVLSATDAALAPIGVALPGARSKLKEAIQVLSEDLKGPYVSEMIRIEERLRREEERDEVLREALAAGQERAKRKVVEEEKSAKQRKALAKLEKSFQDPDESSDGEYDF